MFSHEYAKYHQYEASAQSEASRSRAEATEWFIEKQTKYVMSTPDPSRMHLCRFPEYFQQLLQEQQAPGVVWRDILDLPRELNACACKEDTWYKYVQADKEIRPLYAGLLKRMDQRAHLPPLDEIRKKRTRLQMVEVQRMIDESNWPAYVCSKCGDRYPAKMEYKGRRPMCSSCRLVSVTTAT